jgi:hypothetical protein
MSADQTSWLLTNNYSVSEPRHQLGRELIRIHLYRSDACSMGLLQVRATDTGEEQVRDRHLLGQHYWEQSTQPHDHIRYSCDIIARRPLCELSRVHNTNLI